MKRNNDLTVIDRVTALSMPHPDMGYTKAGRKNKEDSSFVRFDANRSAITAFRRRNFTWAEISTILKNYGLEHSYPSLILWKNTHFTDPQTARPVKRNGVRRGRPPGSKNKPKVAA